MEYDLTANQPSQAFVKATCPLVPDDAEGAPIACSKDPGYDPCWPDILVTFDYNVLGTPPQERTQGAFSASMWIGFAPNSIDVTDTTFSVTLINNIHLMGSWAMNVRRKFHIGSPVPSFMGLFQQYDTFGVIDTAIYGPNTDTTFSSKPNTSSMLLFQLYDPSEWRILEDVSVNSFLRGLSSLGGVFTASNGIFLFVFGFGLMSVLGIDRFSLLKGDKHHPGARKKKAKVKASGTGTSPEQTAH